VSLRIPNTPELYFQDGRLYISGISDAILDTFCCIVPQRCENKTETYQIFVFTISYEDTCPIQDINKSKLVNHPIKRIGYCDTLMFLVNNYGRHDLRWPPLFKMAATF